MRALWLSALCLLLEASTVRVARADEPASPPPAAAAPGKRPSPPPRWYKDWLAPLLALGGVVCVAASALNFSDEQAAYDARAVDYRRYLAARDSPTHLVTDSVFLGVGSALLVGAAVRWALLGVREKRALTVGAAPLAGGAAFTVGGRF